MKVSKKDIDRLAHLSRLQFTDEETERMQSDLGHILSFVEKVNRLDLEKIEPLVYMTDEEDQLRMDKVEKNITKDEALKNAPEKDTDYFKVPKVMRRDNDS
jgi:aspartyl-tRNA(Asn)/glutamyl-tRNA(Gln) amidotransferase subunit C